MPRNARSRSTVLVVDDEPAILNIFAEALPPAGLSVRVAERGDEAVNLFRRHHSEIALVLLDVQMSPWDGPRTLAELRRIDPNVRAAFMSGSTGNHSCEELLGLGVLRIFTKPFPSLAGLTATLVQLVAERGA